MVDELFAKLSKASAADRELDADILEVTGGCAHRETEYYCIEDGNDSDSGFTCKRCHKDTYGQKVPAFTASIDAAIALLSSVLPGRGYTIQSLGSYDATVWEHQPDVGFVSGDATYQVPGATPAIALCAAILKAMQARALTAASEGTDNG